MNLSDIIRTRSVCLKKTVEGQALKACSLLQNLNGVKSVSPINKHRLTLSYSLDDLTFELIEGLLKELGFELDVSIPASLRRSYYQYVEDNVREKLLISNENHTLVCHLEGNDSESTNPYWDQYH